MNNCELLIVNKINVVTDILFIVISNIIVLSVWSLILQVSGKISSG